MTGKLMLAVGRRPQLLCMWSSLQGFFTAWQLTSTEKCDRIEQDNGDNDFYGLSSEFTHSYLSSSIGHTVQP